jgi:hypothetical protein
MKAIADRDLRPVKELAKMQADLDSTYEKLGNVERTLSYTKKALAARKAAEKRIEESNSGRAALFRSAGDYTTSRKTNCNV